MFYIVLTGKIGIYVKIECDIKCIKYIHSGILTIKKLRLMFWRKLIN